MIKPTACQRVLTVATAVLLLVEGAVLPQSHGVGCRHQVGPAAVQCPGDHSGALGEGHVHGSRGGQLASAEHSPVQLTAACLACRALLQRFALLDPDADGAVSVQVAAVVPSAPISPDATPLGPQRARAPPACFLSA